MSHFLICYDITEPHRLCRMHRYLLRRAMPLQYSVFLLDGDREMFEDCMNGAANLIDPRDDDLRGYPLPRRGLELRLGVPVLPRGIFWTGLPVPML